MEHSELIYLDNAATSFPKPYSVTEAVRDQMINCGGNPGRGGYESSLEAARRVFDCRCKLAEMFDAEGPEQVFFTMNTTQGLNACIKGLLRKGDHVLISDIEHNAVYRPIYKLKEKGIVSYDVFPSMMRDCRRNPRRICAEIGKLVKRETKMLICSAASNICSLTMPITEIGSLCRRLGVLFVVDGAQLAGHGRISVRDMKIDALCIPGHKSLLGPQGCGAVVLGKGLKLDTLTEGGNGVSSLEGKMPDESPERYEAGTLPTPAIVGLSAGLDAVRRLGEEQIGAHGRCLFREARDRLTCIRGVTVYCPDQEGAVLSFNLDGYGSEQVASMLADKGICVRGGYHCSALGHKTMGTLESGAVRASFGVFNSSKDVDELYRAVKDIAKARRV